jgi:hypothetical protein
MQGMRPGTALAVVVYALQVGITVQQGPWRPPKDVPTWTPPQERHAPDLKMVGLRGTRGEDNGVQLGAMVQEEWAEGTVRTTDGGRGLLVRGNSRSFLVRADSSMHAGPVLWTDLSFEKLKLLGQQLAFTIDMSQVGCGCDAAVYLVAMPEVSDSIISSGCE